MYITVCGKQIPEDTIQDITITSTKVFIDTTDDYFDLRYSQEEDIKEARDWLQAKQATLPELKQAVSLIILTCNFYINTKEQCSRCPLRRRFGCVFNTIPLNWRE